MKIQFFIFECLKLEWYSVFCIKDGIRTNPQAQEEHDYMKENLRLRKELEETKMENLFLKKAAAFFAKEID